MFIYCVPVRVRPLATDPYVLGNVLVVGEIVRDLCYRQIDWTLVPYAVPEAVSLEAVADS